MPYHNDLQSQMFPSPFQPRLDCPACGSKNIRVGCQYQDCETCQDSEQSDCNVCGAGWGGAAYWRSL